MIVAGLIGSGVFARNYFSSKMQYARMLVTFGPTDVPCTEVTIQGRAYPVLVNLASIVPLTLNKEALSSIKKKPYGTTQFQNINGDKIERPTFLVPEILIEGITFSDVVVAEGECNTGHPVGEMGLPLLRKINLMFDLPHSTIIACNSRDRLKKIGYALEEMIQVPFEIEERAGGVIFPVSSDLGTIKLALGTGCTLSMIRSSFAKDLGTQRDELGVKFISSTFVIGKKDWGNKELYLQDFPSDVPEFNGVIGTDFLNEHIVYVDFENQIIYIGRKF